MIFLGIVIGVAVMALAYFASMLSYFNLRQKHPSAKYGVEIAVLAFAVLFSISIKGLVIFLSEPINGNLWQSIAHTFKAIYSGIGGLTFEGLSDFDSEIVLSIFQCLYAGSSLYAGLMILSVITAKVSYEIYSGLRMAFSFSRNVKKGKTDFYIFTSVNENNLLLAESIVEHYQNQNPTEFLRDCKIVFTGPNLESFDGGNEYHREIMARGYYYWSYSAKALSDEGVISRLKLKFAKDFFIQKPASVNEENRVHFFAMSANARQSGLESTNSDEVFGEIENLTLAFIGGAKAKERGKYKFTNTAIIDFYVLSDTEINYEFYIRELYKRVLKVIKEQNVPLLYSQLVAQRPELKDVKILIKSVKNEKLAKIVSYLVRYFQIHAINEAYESSKSLIKERKNAFLSDEAAQITNELAYFNDGVPTSDNLFRTMVLGFGKNGQQSMKVLYENTAYVDENGKPSRFVADVYDPYCNSISGLFGFNHPMFICVDKKNGVESVTPSDWACEQNRLKNLYGENTVNHYLSEIKKELADDKEYQENPEHAQKVNDYLNGLNLTSQTVIENSQLPVVAFHNVSTFNHEFLSFLDEKTGSDSFSSKNKYKAFIIALGNDELNILMANALIANIKHEHDENGVRNDPSFVRTIYVNIRDEKNHSRINWTKIDEKRLRGNKVVIYGDRKDIYSYDSIINDVNCMKYDYSYNNVHTKIEAHGKNLLMGEQFDLKAVKQIIDQTLQSETIYYDMRFGWLKNNLFKRQSNQSVHAFSPYYKIALRNIVNNKSLTESQVNEHIARLSAIEHERWNRFHIANGWIFEKQKNEDSKEHNCLCPYDMLTLSTKVYDLSNVLLNVGNLNEE